ncbi:heme A synthase, partial [Phycicoccus sp. CMS6Z-2]|nr:heme A synthase [Phycicoccus flavus]
LDPQLWSHVHAASVYALVAVTAAVLWLARRTSLRGPAALVLGVELAQGAVGLVQYWTGLPIGLVAIHLVGAGALVASATWLAAAARRPEPADAPAAEQRAEPAPVDA